MTHHLSPITHSPTIALREFEACEVALSWEAYAALRARYAGRIDVEPTERAGVYRVAARDYVGRVGMPGGGILTISPKVTTANLFYMLCVEAGPAEFKPPPLGLAEDVGNQDILAFVAAALLDAVGQLLEVGIYRGYVLQQGSMEPVRGHIVMSAQISRYGDLKHRHICSYAELTADTPENRIIAAALGYIPWLLSRQIKRDNILIRRAGRYSAGLEGVNAASRGEAIALLRLVGLHRLTAAYGPVLGLCRLLLQHLSFQERPGPYPFASFLVNMPRLFESFLTARLSALLRGHGLRAQAQRHDYLDEERTVGIRPDLLVFPARGKEPLLVLDFKYRNLDEPGASANQDLYQLSAYMDRYKLRPGMLVYPQFEGAPSTRLKIKGTGKQLHLASVNLGAPTPSALEAECTSLANTVIDIARSKGE